MLPQNEAERALLNELLERLLTDEAFRQQLLEQPEEILMVNGYYSQVDETCQTDLANDLTSYVKCQSTCEVTCQITAK